MKKLFVFTAFFLLIPFFCVTNTQAVVPASGGPFASAFQIQNLGTSQTQCTYTLYDSTGGEVYTTPTPILIDPGKGYQVYTPAVSGMPTGMFSGVISCDQEVAAVSNFSDTNSGASYKGIKTGSSVSYVPALYDNYYGFYSNVVVQNLSASPIDVTLDIYAAGGVAPVKQQSKVALAAYASVAFDQQGAAELNPNVVYSGKITATGGEIGAIVNYHGGDQLYSYNAFNSGSEQAYAPVIMNNFYGFNTALTVQNIGSSPADVTVAYGIPGHDWSGTIQPNSSKELYTPSSGLPVGANTGAKVSTTSAQPLVVLVNESTNTLRAASYSGFTNGANIVKTPIVYKRYYNYNTSITCQNLGTNPTTMRLEYGGIAGQNDSTSIDPGKTHLFYQPSDTLIPNGFNGSATITSLAGEPIVCVVNESINEGPLASQLMDQLYAYEGIF